MSKRTYLALSTINYSTNGYTILAISGTKSEAEKLARQKIGDVSTDYGTDFEKQTLHTNLIIISKSAAFKRYGVYSLEAERYHV